MKRSFLLAALLAAIIFCGCVRKKASSNISSSADALALMERKIDDKMVAQLKNTTTVFFYGKSNLEQLESLKQAVTSGWNLTPVIFDSIGNFDKYAANPRYSYFVMEAAVRETRMGSGANSSVIYNTHYYLVLNLFKATTGKGKLTSDKLCRIELYPNYTTMAKGERYYPKKGGKTLIQDLYDDGTFYNFTPVLINAQLQTLTSNLNDNIRPWLFRNVRNENLTNILSNDTLYVPKSVLSNQITRETSTKFENLFSSYKYKYRICTDSELFDIFEIQKRGRLLFEYVKSSTDKFVTVYDLEKKSIVYKQYTPLSYALKSKDLKF
jgi:hypothetical protein